MQKYEIKKGFESGGQAEKSERQRFLTRGQVNDLLTCIEQAGKTRWKRDHCGIYLGFYLGLRCSETVILERESFRFIDDGQVMIRTKKQVPRVPLNCAHCGRRWRISGKLIKLGRKAAACPRCGTEANVPSGLQVDLNPPEYTVPAVETKVLDYIENYLEQMRPEQRWLLESKPGVRLSSVQLRKIFNSYAQLCGLPKEYSFHSLRHGRGVLVWERFKDLVMVKGMLRQKSLTSAEVYMHLSPDNKRKYQAALDAAMEEE
jgi:integrase